MAIWERPEFVSGETTIIGTQGVQPELAILTIHTGLVTFEWAYRLRILQINQPYIYLHSSNAPYDVSRETITRVALQYPSVKWIFYLDSDTVTPIDAIPVLMQLSEANKREVISGLYWARKREGNMPCAWIKTGESKQENKIDYSSIDITPYLNKNAIVDIDVAGCGCLLVRSDVFRRLDESNPNKPFFQWGVGRKDDQTGKPLLQLSEDFYFFNRVKNELKIQPCLSTAVKCHHICMGQKRAQDGQFELI